MAANELRRAGMRFFPTAQSSQPAHGAPHGVEPLGAVVRRLRPLVRRWSRPAESWQIVPQLSDLLIAIARSFCSVLSRICCRRAGNGPAELLRAALADRI